MDLENCKRCLLYEMAGDEAYKSVNSYIESMNEELKEDLTIYRERLSICKECDYLLNGMCRACGCYVEIRAIRKGVHCPAAPQRW